MTPRPKNVELSATLRTIAMRYPEVEEGGVCTKLAFKARNNSFLFVGCETDSHNVMVKLGESLPEAATLAEKSPQCYKVGVYGWVTATFRLDEFPPSGLLERWIDESYRLLAPKKLAAQLASPVETTRPPTTKKKAVVKKPRSR